MAAEPVDRPSAPEHLTIERDAEDKNEGSGHLDSSARTLRFRPETQRAARLPWRVFIGFVAVLAAVLWLGSRLDGLGIPSYQVIVTGLPREAGVPSSPLAARAFPETPIRISAMPRRIPWRKVEVALYREAGVGLERIEGAAVRGLPAAFGAAELEARAADLVADPVPGLHRIYLIVAPAGRLPRHFDLGSGETPTSARIGHSFVTLQIDLLATAGSGADLGVAAKGFF